MIVAGVGQDDEVICPSMSYIATANSIKYVGAKPVFAEIIPETYNLDVGGLAEKKLLLKQKLFYWYTRSVCLQILMLLKN